MPSASVPPNSEETPIVRNALSAYGSRGVLVLSTLLLTPILFRALGTRGFGTWSVIFAASVIFELIEVGFTRGLTKMVAELLAKRRREELEQTLGASITLIGSLGLPTAGIAVALAVWGTGLAAAGQSHAFRIGMLALAVDRLLYFPLASYGAALAGYQRYDLLYLSSIISTLSFTAGAIGVVWLGGGVAGVAVAFAATHLLTGFLWAVFLFRTDRRLSLRPRLGDRRTRWKLFSFSSFVLLAESMTFISLRLDTLVIAAIRNAAAAGPYAAMLKIQSGVQSLTLPFVYMLMPMTSGLKARREEAEIVRRFSLSTRIVLQITLPVAALFALFARDTVGLWLGSGAPSETASILVVLMVVQVPLLTAAPAEQVLVGVGRVRTIGFLAVAEGISNIGLSIGLVYKYGAIGAALGSLFTSSLIAPIKLPLAARIVGVRLGSLVRESVLPAVASSLPSIMLMLVIRVGLSQGEERLALGAALGVGAALAVAARQLRAEGIRTLFRKLSMRDERAPAGS